MKKNWKVLYLISSSIVFVLIAIICSFGFYNGTVNSVLDKYNFESIYINSRIDFIVPSPSFEQVGEIENSESSVDAITPYYFFNTSLDVNDKSIMSNVVLLDDNKKINYTPYNDDRLLSGTFGSEQTFAVVDEAYSKKNNCKIGDQISLVIDSKKFSFVVKAISENNPFYEDSIALVIKNYDSKVINANNFKYSAAYVHANDYSECKNFLETEYKPLGRLKNRDDFPTDEAYNTHLQNFNSADWTKEITYMKDNYSLLSLKYVNVEKGAISNTIIDSFVLFAAFVAFNLIVINLPSEKKRFQELLTKKKGTLKDIKNYNLKGNLFSLLVFILSYGLLSLLILMINGGFAHFDLLYVYTTLPFVAIFVGLIVNLIVSKVMIEKYYSRN